jgi:hypothetical protein
MKFRLDYGIIILIATQRIQLHAAIANGIPSVAERYSIRMLRSQIWLQASPDDTSC